MEMDDIVRAEIEQENVDGVDHGMAVWRYLNNFPMRIPGTQGFSLYDSMGARPAMESEGIRMQEAVKLLIDLKYVSRAGHSGKDEQEKRTRLLAKGHSEMRIMGTERQFGTDIAAAIDAADVDKGKILAFIDGLMPGGSMSDENIEVLFTEQFLPLYIQLRDQGYTSIDLRF